MTVTELKQLINARDLTPSVSTEREVSCGYTCDLLAGSSGTKRKDLQAL